MREELKHPPRTIGIAVAVMLSIITYTVLPTILVVFTAILKYRLNTTDVTVGIGGPAFIGGSVGFISITIFELVLWGAGALSFMVISVFAWRGKPSPIRFVFVGAILVMPLWYGLLWFYRTYQDARNISETGAFLPDTSVPSLCSAFIMLPLFITVYVVWYMNRGPARAFYRGYYLDRPSEQRPDTPPT